MEQTDTLVLDKNVFTGIQGCEGRHIQVGKSMPTHERRKETHSRREGRQIGTPIQA